MGKAVYPLIGTITIGYIAENESREIALDIAQMKRTWPELKPALIARRPGEKHVYMGVTRVDGDTLIWTVTNADTAIAGEGEMRIAMTDDEARVIGKSRIVKTKIGEGMQGETDGKIPVAIEPWIEGVLREIGSIRSGYVSIEQGEENAGMALVVGEDGRVTLQKGGGIDEEGLFDALNRWDIIKSLRDDDGAYLADDDGAVMTYDKDITQDVFQILNRLGLVHAIVDKDGSYVADKDYSTLVYD